jgi:hypothetical protein
MAIVFSVVGVLLAFQGLWLLCSTLWPGLVQSTCADCNGSLVKSFFVGLPLAVAALFAITNFGKLGPAGDIGAVASLSIFVIFSAIGTAGLACVLGNRLAGMDTLEYAPSRLVRGGAVLELAFLFPLAGWFFILPLTLVIGTGATVRALLRRGPRPIAVSTRPENTEINPTVGV